MVAFCPVCEYAAPRFFMTVEGRDYWRCERCVATFLDPGQHPPLAREVAEYDRHENDLHDPGYRRFLARLTDPLRPLLSETAQGLDFGCGPGPALVAMMAEHGFDMAAYDPIYAPDDRLLERRYDFITCTEVVEHLFQPADVFRLLDRMLKPGGWLGVMTQFQTDDERFAGWHYRRDPTHVVFYREETFRWLAGEKHWSVQIPRKNVVLFHKPETKTP